MTKLQKKKLKKKMKKERDYEKPHLDDADEDDGPEEVVTSERRIQEKIR